MSDSEYGAPCMCGGCRTCLRDQGYDPDAPDEDYCEGCGDPMPYEERVEVAGDVLCEKCAAKAAQKEAGVSLEA
jgi:hypothetical protein